jgi:hypothetical protein
LTKKVSIDALNDINKTEDLKKKDEVLNEKNEKLIKDDFDFMEHIIKRI